MFHSTSSEGAVKYMKYLTPYAYQFISKQLNLMNKVKLSNVNNDLLTSSSENNLEITSTSCTCCSWQSMRLPCRHIFALRVELGLDVYEESLCDKRWTMEYYRENQRIFQEPNDPSTVNVEVLHLPAPKTKVLSQVPSIHS